MVGLPFKFPVGVHDESRRFDKGFLDSLFPNLTFPVEPISNFEKLHEWMRKFTLYNSKLMLYASRYQPNLWFPLNYAYENVKFFPEENGVFGNAYPVTGWDGTLTYGEISKPISFVKNRDPIIFPCYLDDNLKGAVFGQRYGLSVNHYDICLLIGNKNNKEGVIEMPSFNKSEVSS